MARRTLWQRLARAARNRWGAWRLRFLGALGLAEPLIEAAGPGQPIGARPVAAPPAPAAASERAALGHPALVELRRRAIEDLFDWLGCTAVPPQVWPILDRLVDPDEALRRLARSLGLDVADLQARRGPELDRFRRGVDLLIDLAGLADRLGPQQRQEVHDLLFAGDFERVEAMVAALHALQSALRSWEDLAGHRRLTAHRRLIDRLERLMQRPAEIEPELAETLLRRADRLHDATLALDRLARRGERAMQGLRAHWPWRWEAGERMAERGRLFQAYQGLEREILDGPHEEVTALLGDLEQAVAALEALLQAAFAEAAGGSEWDRAEPEPSPADPVATAFAFFRLDRGGTLDRRSLDRARRRTRAEHHPDRFRHPADKALHEAIFKEIDGHYEVLRRHGLAVG